MKRNERMMMDKGEEKESKEALTYPSVAVTRSHCLSEIGEAHIHIRKAGLNARLVAHTKMR